MNKSLKLPEIRRQAFTKGRESLGLSTKDLSRKSCLSVRQIEQIENGESSSFYGPQVKVTAAKKVAGILNLKEEDAFDFGDTPQAIKSDSEKPAQEITIDVTLSATPKEKQSEKNSEPLSEAPVQKPIAFNQTPDKNPKKKLFILLGLAAALVFSFVNLRPLLFPEASVAKEELVVVQEVVPAQASEEAKQTPTAPAPESVAALAAAPSSDCPAADGSGVSYMPDAPKKAGDMVYLQSKTAQTVCVVDAAGKIQNKLLEPGVGVSLYGKPPFKVLTSGLAQVDLYYQGAKVRLSNIAAKTIRLEPAEVVQPLAPADSQLR